MKKTLSNYKKISYILCLFTIGCQWNTLSAQSYHPLLVLNKEWTLGCQENQNPNLYYEYQKIVDTLTINEMLYYKVMSGLDTMSYYMREDILEQKVFTYFPNTSQEFVTFDFDVNVGDTLVFTGSVVHGFSDSVFTTEIMNIYEFQVDDGSYRKHIIGHGIIDNGHWFQYIEGLGGYWEGLISPINGYGNNMCIIASVYENSQYTYSTIGLDENDFSLDIFYDIKTKVLYLELLDLKGMYTISNTLGQYVLSGQLENEIQISGLLEGVYIFQYVVDSIDGIQYFKFVVE